MDQEKNKKPQYKIKPLPRDKDGQYQKTFFANGKNYKILGWQDGLSMDRWQVYQQLSIEGGYDITFQSLYNHLHELEEMLNKSFTQGFKAADFIIKLRALKDGIASKAVQRVPKVMRLAAVFIVREDEDIRYYDSTLADEKIKDWEDEGYDVQDFFTIALSSIQGWSEVLKSIMENG